MVLGGRGHLLIEQRASHRRGWTAGKWRPTPTWDTHTPWTRDTQREEPHMRPQWVLICLLGGILACPCPPGGKGDTAFVSGCC